MASQERITSFLNANLRRIYEDRFLWANAAFHEALNTGKEPEAANAYDNMTQNRERLEMVYEDMRIWHRSLGHITAEEVLKWREAKFPSVG
jgi:hypothetical protein